MYIEGFAVQEISRIRQERFRDEADAWRQTRLVKTSRAGILTTVGDSLIRVGGRLAGVGVDSCLARERQESPAGA